MSRSTWAVRCRGESCRFARELVRGQAQANGLAVGHVRPGHPVGIIEIRERVVDVVIPGEEEEENAVNPSP